MLRRVRWWILPALLSALVCPGLGSAGEPKAESKTDASPVKAIPVEAAPLDQTPLEASLPEEWNDPAFDRFLDPKMLGTALSGRDAAGVTDCAMMLLEGERVLGRSHKAVKSDSVLSMAIRLAGEAKDKATLARLAKAVKALDKKDLQTQLDLAQQLASTARRAVAPLGVDIAEVSPEQVHLYAQITQQIESARLLGDGEELNRIKKLVAAEQIHEKMKRGLEKAVAEAVAALPEKADADTEVLVRLAKSSRGSQVVLCSIFNATREVMSVTFPSLSKTPLLIQPQTFIIVNGPPLSVLDGVLKIPSNPGDIRNRSGGTNFFLRPKSSYVYGTRSQDISGRLVFTETTPLSPLGVLILKNETKKSLYYTTSVFPDPRNKIQIVPGGLSLVPLATNYSKDTVTVNFFDEDGTSPLNPGVMSRYNKIYRITSPLVFSNP